LFEPLQGSLLELLTIVVAVVAGAAFSALEAALVAFGEVRLHAAKEEGGNDAATAERVLREGTRFTTRLLTARVVAIVVSVGFTVGLLRQYGLAWWVTPIALTILALSYATLAVGFGAIARARAQTWAFPMLRIMRPFELLFWPLSAPLAELVRFLDRRFPPPPPPQNVDQAVREVEHMIEQREESGTITEEFAELLLSVLEFKDTVAREVMVPRIEMKAIEIDTPIDEVMDFIVREGHSRYPVYRDRPDQIEGVLYAKDLFRMVLLSEGERKQASLERIIRRPVFFVAETHKIGQLLREMQTRRFHLAIVVDEFGGTSGIVTLEDILEEIVGDIRDEHDTEDPLVTEIAPGRWSVDARISIYDLGEIIGVDFEKELEGDYDSLGGMIVDLADGVPEVGETVSAHGLDFTVREADERRVTRVDVVRRSPADAANAAAE
jgi:putative hemolysin